jgi:hypothetical protein
MSAVEFEALLEDMKQHGYDQKMQVVMFEGQVLDGWHRQRAGVMTDKMPTYDEYKGDDPMGFVVRRNLSRRHLTPSQKSITAGNLIETAKRTGCTNLCNEKVAKILQIHRNSVAAGAKVVQHGDEELQDAVMDGTVAIHDAVAITDQPKKRQRRAVRSVRKGNAKTVTDAVSKFDEADKEEDAPEPTIDDEIKAKNTQIESFCRRLMKLADEIPNDVWLDDSGRRDAALQKFRDGCASLRAAKCVGACPKCSGDGCQKCKKSGRVPKLVHDQLV